MFRENLSAEITIGLKRVGREVSSGWFFGKEGWIVLPKVQISLDLTNLEEALKTAEQALAAGVDWLEAGTPLILAEEIGRAHV